MQLFMGLPDPEEVTGDMGEGTAPVVQRPHPSCLSALLITVNCLIALEQAFLVWSF